jgi:hypothetical protein
MNAIGATSASRLLALRADVLRAVTPTASPAILNPLRTVASAAWNCTT